MHRRRGGTYEIYSCPSRKHRYSTRIWRQWDGGRRMGHVKTLWCPICGRRVPMTRVA